MTEVDNFIDELGRLPHSNENNLTWFVEADYSKRVVKIVMKDRTRKPVKTMANFISFDDIYAMNDPRKCAALIVKNMYYDFGEHIIDEKLLMSTDEAAGILKEFTTDFEELGGWNVDDAVLITALKVAIKCLEVTS